MGEVLKQLKGTLKSLWNYIKYFIRWGIAAILVGLVGGAVGSFFHKCLDIATELRGEKPYLIYILPLAGVLIVGMYRVFKSKGKLDTNRVIESAREQEKVPFILSPLIFISTVLTQLFGGSAGREGAALQLGGSIGYNLGRCFRLSKADLHIIVMAGMASVFSALFGTPLTAAIFALEVTMIGNIKYSGLFPCTLASLVAYKVAISMGVSPVAFSIMAIDSLSLEILLKVSLLALLSALVAIVFCISIKKCEAVMEKTFKNIYLRAFFGGLIIVGLTLLLNTTDYNGAGMNIVERAMSGVAKPEAFLLKIIFTAITFSAGFKGGEIVPTLFIGSTFGCVLGPVLGLDPAIGAAIGFVALFCGVVNCPIASFILALEVFGGTNIMLFALVSAISFMASGYFGLYKSQKFAFSKISDEVIDINAK